MTKLWDFEAVAAPLVVSNVDTGRIFPSRFLRKPHSGGLGPYFFYDERYDAKGAPRPDFILNRAPFDRAQVLVAGGNFGCGSSREAAVLAMIDAGFRCVIASSFGAIFYTSCFRCGLLPAILAEQGVRAVGAYLIEHPGSRIHVNLADESISLSDGTTMKFEIERAQKERLLSGLDDCALALKESSRIEEFVRCYTSAMPWLRCGPTSAE